MSKQIKELCTPAYLYLVISVTAFVLMVVQNLEDPEIYCMGNYRCRVDSKLSLFLGKALYILFWTWLLNVFCKAGYKSLSWFIVLFPVILMFVLIGGFMMANPTLVI